MTLYFLYKVCLKGVIKCQFFIEGLATLDEENVHDSLLSNSKQMGFFLQW
jgi:hypothetical protein